MDLEIKNNPWGKWNWQTLNLTNNQIEIFASPPELSIKTIVVSVKTQFNYGKVFFIEKSKISKIFIPTEKSKPSENFETNFLHLKPTLCVENNVSIFDLL